jgi:AcrR family transcriptional regulator
VRESKKYRDILAHSKKLFWKFGLKRVTVEELCHEAGVSKMTFYKYFSNKNELVLEILRRMFDENMEKFKDFMDADIPFEEKMKIQIQFKLEGTNDISEEFIKDVYGDSESEIQRYWHSRADEMIGEVVEYYRSAQEKGWLRRDLKIEFIIYIINKFFDFVKDDQLIAQYKTMQDLIMEINKFFLYGILPHPQEKR